MTAHVLGVASLLASVSLSFSTARSDQPRTVLRLDQPFLFAYGTWENRVRVESGRAWVDAPGITPRGGAGLNRDLDLSPQKDACPALRVTVKPGNTMPALKLLIRDDKERSGSWLFKLPDTPTRNVLLTPADGQPWSRPEVVEPAGAPAPDLARIRQVQLIGDWTGDGAVAIEVFEVLSAPPDAATLARRQARANRERDAALASKAEHDALKQRYARRTDSSPRVVRVGMAAPDVVALRVQAGRVVPGSLRTYTAEPGDDRRESKGPNGSIETVKLVRGGQEVGWLIGPKRDQLVAFERLEGDPLLEFLADEPGQYKLTSEDDPSYRQGIAPRAVARKSKPTDWAQPGGDFAMQHDVYLRLPRPLVPGKHYRIALGELNTREPSVDLAFDPDRLESEAIHVNQVGFRPDDPLKQAFLSLWAGTGGGLTYPEGLTFRVVETQTGRTVHTGKVATNWPADRPEALARPGNYVHADVWRMDFAPLRQPGLYRVVVDGIGCGPTFEIGDDVWTKAFRTQMRGLFNNRSGVALGPPDTDFVKPRDFHPSDGVRVTRSGYAAMEQGGEAFAALAAGDTGEAVPDAWGGWHDAGDWNPRRVTHMSAVLAQLELYELFPEKLSALELGIPKEKGLPDVLTEALFELDCFRRLQQPDGGVPHGIETPGDPIEGEVSWLQSLPAYVFAADEAASWYYASVAARAARLLEKLDAPRARDYRASAERAMSWAEQRHAQRIPSAKAITWEARDARNLAALELYRLTGDKKWHALFLEDTCLKDEDPRLFDYGNHIQTDAAFAYARLKPPQADPKLQSRARAGIVALADSALTYGAGNAFGLTRSNPYRPMMNGFYSTSDGVELVRAHFLTGDQRYLAGAVQGCQFPLGANPANMVYTTGLGTNPVQHPLHLDSRRTGQPAPEGLTVYGNVDFHTWTNSFYTWPITYHLSRLCTPSVYTWPISEAYFDIFLYPGITEFTVDNWTPNIYVWGYLAFRP